MSTSAVVMCGPAPLRLRVSRTQPTPLVGANLIFENTVFVEGVTVRRTVFSEEHETFRKVVSGFMETEVVPQFPEWEKQGYLPREFFAKLGALGVTGMAIPEEYGGGAVDDYRFNVVMQEEAARALVS